MTYLAWWCQYAWTLVVQRIAPVPAAFGTSIVIGYGVMGWLALRSIEPPWRERVGWKGLAPATVPALLFLAPIPIVSLAVQAVVRAPLLRGATEGIWEWRGPMLEAGSDLGLVGVLLLVVVVVPALTEWFFRGIIQQGVVARWGPVAGVLWTAALYGAIVAGLRTNAGAWVAIFAGTFVAGCVFGLARQATGSLAAAVVAHVGASALYALLHLAGNVVSISFVSAPGRLVPLPVVAIALGVIAPAALLLLARARRAA